MTQLRSITEWKRQAEEWVKKNGGGIFELHSYAVPDDFPENEIRNQFLKEFEEYFPGDKRLHKLNMNILQVKDDFTAFHTNLFKNRPAVKTDVENLFLAGDWVKLEKSRNADGSGNNLRRYMLPILFSAKKDCRKNPFIRCLLRGVFA
ncbi:MAG: hypothetical protein M0C28_04925 [Candidatus Moduliflexus flocculans]|nr:hypothetical protein [Candidatus Moduliflexus flocculans]